MVTLQSPAAAVPPSATPRPRLQRIAAVVNSAAGSVGPDAADALSALVAEHGYQLALSAPAPGEIGKAVREAVDAAPDLLLILAGDGTARLAAELSGPDGPMVAPLAGGTLNMLPHAIYGAIPWRDALTALLDGGVEQDVSGGKVDGRAFFVAAVLGSPALWSNAREALRKGRLLEMGRRAQHALSRAFSGPLRFGVDGGAGGVAEALALITPLVSKKLEGQTALEMAAFDLKDALEVARLAFNGLLGEWRNDPAVRAHPVERGWASARRRIPCILDGESLQLPRKVGFEFTPRAFRTLAPPLPDGP